MNAKLRFWIGVGILGLLMTGPFLLTAVVLMADAQGPERQALIDLLAPRLPLGALITVMGFIVGVAVLRGLFKHYVRGLMAMSEKMRLMLGANKNFRVEYDGPPEVRELARAVNDLAQQRDELLGDVEAQIGAAKATVEEEKNRLAALMSELTQAVVVCNLDGRILLYNSRARLQFKALAQGPTAMSGGALIGLGRSIFSVLERGQVAYALEHIQMRLRRGSSAPSANFIVTTRAGQLLRAQMAPVLRTGPSGGAESPLAASPLPGTVPDVASGSAESASHALTPHAREGSTRLPQAALAEERGDTVANAAAAGEEPQITGYVLTIENITRNFEREAQRDQALQQLTDGSRASLGNLRAAVETLLDSPEMDLVMRGRLMNVIADETAAMSQRLDHTTREFADSLKTRWPLEDMLGIDLVAAAASRVEQRLKLPTKTEDLDAELWIRAESFSLLQAITFVGAKLQEQYDVRELRFRLGSEGKMAFLDLIWAATPMSSETFHTWELEPMEVGQERTPLTLRDVVQRHGGEIWFQREKAAHRCYLRLVLPVAQAPESLPELDPALSARRSGSRPEYYDFDLFGARDATGIDLDRKLAELAYSVFDTETTGLDPSGGDEIIQIGAVRIVNNRLLRQEVFDQLVDPGIPLKPEGIPIHGITEDMVRGQPGLDVVLPAFHEFCAETVLVAHNAAFDMRFLQLKEATLGLVFAQPVLDTLLLSAVIHPNQESHRLEAIAQRLGINVIGRHTALGDAFVTGDIFLKMIPLLAERGILTLRQALDASQQTYLARVSY